MHHSGLRVADSPLLTRTATSLFGFSPASPCRLGVIVRTRSSRRGNLGLIFCVMACAVMVEGCELDNAGAPQIIAGPSVPSPVPLRAPYVWDMPDELVVWT